MSNSIDFSVFSQPFDEQEFRRNVLALREPKNVAFDEKILKTPKIVLGIRVPILRQIVASAKSQAEEIARNLRTDYYEFEMLKGLFIAQVGKGRTKIENSIAVDKVLELLENFVPEIDNWSTCDLMCGDLRIVEKNRERFIPFIDKCLASRREFVIRVGIVLLMKFYLDDDHRAQTFEKLKNLKSDFYYVNMALGWLICESFLHDKEQILNFLETAGISPLAINKGVQKIRESYRVSLEDKALVLKYKRQI